MGQIKVQGLDRLVKKLTALGGDADEAIDKGLMRGAKMVQAAAKNSCRLGTSQLKNSIEVHKINKGTLDVGTNVEHAFYNEFGTGTKGDPSVPHTTKEKWVYKDASGNWYTTHGMTPKPFLAPALHDNEDNVVNGIVHELQGTIRKVGGVT